MKHFGRNEIKLVRYADDFVIFSKKLKNIQLAEKLVVEFLKPIGLKLSKDKTNIGHSLTKLPGTSGSIGLDFLSFNFKNIQCSKHRGVKSTQGVKQTFRLVTSPSKEAVVKHKKALSRILVDYKSAPMGRIMEKLSFKIRGWTWYHSVTQSTKTFSKLDEWLWKKLWKWAKWRHRGAKKAKLKCFSVQNWNFGYITNEGSSLILDRHDKTNVRKFIKIKSGYSIYNGDLVYFAKRLSLSNPRIKNLNNLFKKQKFSCTVCFLPLLPNQVVELHHHLDGNGERTHKINFVHGHCHDKIHSNL
jgi:RNA-directed DNA polymerase